MIVFIAPYQKANYTIAMNGQTGKLRVDDLPDDSLYFSAFKKIYLIIQIIDLFFRIIVFKVR